MTSGEHHDGRGNLRLQNGANWGGHYMITVRADPVSGARLAHGLFTPRFPAEPIFLVAHGGRIPATLTLEDGREVEAVVMFNGAASVDMVFEDDPFPG